MTMTLQELLKKKTRIVEYRTVKINGFGDYVADNYPTIPEEEDADLQNSDFSQWEIDHEADGSFMNMPPSGVTIKKEDTEERFVYVFE